MPDYVLWLAAALSDSVLTGINSTYRGDQLGSPPTGQEKLTDRLVQVGLRTATTTTATSSSASAVETIEAGCWDDAFRLTLTTPVYLSLDMDGLDPACLGMGRSSLGGRSPRSCRSTGGRRSWSRPGGRGEPAAR